MKLVVIFLSLLISNFLFAQNNVAITPVSTKASLVSAPVEKKNEKKVHYVEKRTKPVQNNAKTVSGSQTQKKPVIQRAENQKKTASK